MLHVYAIADSYVSPEVVGLDGAALHTVGEEAPFAVVSEHDRPPAEPSEDVLWAHERVVEGLMDRATILPMRFDGSVADEATLELVLEERRAEFEALFDRVRGAVELGVRAQLSDLEEEPEAGSDEAGGEGERAGPGTTYLLERVRDRRRAAEVATQIHEPLAALSRRSARLWVSVPSRLFKVAYLVDRDRVDAFRARVDVLDSELDGQVVCTGPWPPYSFSSKEGG